ncbi:hypothetical protein A2U01_0080182, partial [Trifolium medium]|nr:hypothetical protein [Trifolium medium]
IVLELIQGFFTVFRENTNNKPPCRRQTWEENVASPSDLWKNCRVAAGFV